MASTPRALPSPDEILERENGQRRVAVIGASAGAVLTAIAAIVDSLTNAGVPKPDRAADLVETINAQATGADFPASFWTAYAQFRVDHALETIAAAGLRGIALVAIVPMTLFLLRGARERGGTLGKWLEPLAVSALVALGVATFLHQILEVQAFRDAGPVYVPQQVFDAVGNNDLLAISSLRGILALVIALPIALVAIQAMRVGLLPRLLGYFGVFVGLLFVVQFDTTGLIRALWFGFVAVAVAGRLPSGPIVAWETGTAVAPEPRQPPAPREPKGGKGAKAAKGAGDDAADKKPKLKK